MRKNSMLAIYILILSLILLGCSDRSVRTQSPAQEVKTSDSAEKDSAKMSEEKKAEQIKAREELEAQRKAASGEFYVPLPALGQEPELNPVKAKALYLTANVAGFDFNEEDVDYYADY
ncbi:MAG: hypothetical protein AAGU75_16310, partial [Bacillota bacterium]